MPPLVVADTAPLNCLVLIEAVDILPRLYGSILIPPAVKLELSDSGSPTQVRTWIHQPPAWLQVVSPSGPVDSSLAHLDPGEREAIVLAKNQDALLLMDERDGVTAARTHNLRVIGTLGALDIAAERGWIDLRAMFGRLRQTTFRVPHRLMETMLDQDAQRKKPSTNY